MNQKELTKIPKPKCCHCGTEEVIDGGVDDEGNFFCKECWEELEG